MVFIYTLAHPLTREIRYIGMTRNKKRRESEYKHGRACAPLIQEWLQGFTDPPLMVIHDVVTEEEGSKRERFWIAHFRRLGFNLLNQTDGGEIGYTMQRRETKPKKPQKAKEKKEHAIHFGRPISDAHKQAIRNGWTPERRKAQSEIMSKIYLDKKAKTCYA